MNEQSSKELTNNRLVLSVLTDVSKTIIDKYLNEDVSLYNTPSYNLIKDVTDEYILNNLRLTIRNKL